MRIFLIICLVSGLAACSNVTKEKLGLAKNAPNEHLVEEKAPLSLPPEFQLRPVNQTVDNADAGEY